MNFFLNSFFGNKQPSNGKGQSSPSAIPAFEDRPTALDSQVSRNAIPQNIAPIWPTGTALDISLYVSPSLVTTPLKSFSKDALVLEEKSFKTGDWKDKRQVDTSFPVPKEVQNNATLWGHFYVAISGNTLDPLEAGYDNSKAYYFVRPLTQYLPKKKAVKAKWLLGGSNNTEAMEQSPQPDGSKFSSYYHPNFTFSAIPESGTLNYPTMHPALRQHLHLETTQARDASGQNGWYYPIIYVNTFWQLRDQMMELNSTVKRLPLHIELNNLNWWKFSILASVDEGMKRTQKQIANGGAVPAAGDGSELEEFKRILLDTNIYLLGTTAIVSVLHMIFETLAFKNDIVSFSQETPDFKELSAKADLSHTGGIRRTT